MQRTKQKGEWNYGACETCESDSSVVPTLNLVLSKRGKRGNPYRGFCLNCQKWATLTSRSVYFDHPDPHILMPHSSLKEGDVRPVSETEYEIDGDQLRRGDRVVFAPRRNYTPFSERGEGDEPIESGPERDPEPEQPDGEPAPEENDFDCPVCGEPVVGFPDECPHDGCRAVYSW